MHSSLHSELRLTHRLVKSSCRHSSCRCESPRRYFHQGRNLCSSQGARNDAGSQSTPPNAKEDLSTPRDPSIAPNIPFTKHPLPSTAGFTASNGRPPSEEPNFSQIPGFYGSSRNRRQRANAVKELPKPEVKIPQWFVEHKTVLHGERELSAESETSIAYFGQKQASGTYFPGVPDDGNGPDAPKESRTEGKDDAYYSEDTRRKIQPHAFCFKRRKTTTSPPRYWVCAWQDREIVLTAAGLINPSRKSEFESEPANKTSHLLLHYAGRNGELLLDEYVRNLAYELDSNLMTLDAQDIAELIATSNQQPDVVTEGRYLSYAVLEDTKSSSDNTGDSVFSTDEDVDEDMDEGDAFDGAPPARLPGVVMKLGSIDLSSLWGGPRRQRTEGMGSRPDPVFGPMQNMMQKARPTPAPFTDLIDRILAVMQEKVYKVTAAKQGNEDQKEGTVLSGPRTIIHIPDVKSIQETDIGGRFLAELFEQVEKRRNNGESMILIGTECDKYDPVVTSRSGIEEMERLKNHEISRTIVMTPILPEPRAKGDLSEDRRRRTAVINLRHIYEMMRLKTSHGQLNLLEFMPATPEMMAWVWASTDMGKKVLTFSEVHRLVTMIEGLNTIPKEMRNSSDDSPALRLAQIFLQISNNSKVAWLEKQSGGKKSSSKPSNAEDPVLAKIRASATKHEKRLLSGVIEPSKIGTTFNDVHAPIETIDALQTLTTLSLIRPEAFSYGVLASDKIPGLLLYGPPGTGKTLLAKAVAKESGARVLEVSAADINDMYVGEGEKNVKALFSLAKKLSPCVVFLDEADAMFSARSNSGRRVSHRELLNQFLKEWDGMSNDSGSAFIMVATNRPMDLDDAVLRRLPRRLLVDLPTEHDRHEILKIHARNEQLDSTVDLADLAQKTPFYSGSDLKNVVVAAALNAVREENEAAKQHKAKAAESSHDNEAEEPEEYKYPEKRTLTAKHFEKALEEITASISEDMTSLKDIKKFDEQYGDKKGKKRKKAMWGFKSGKDADRVLDTVKVRDV